MAGLIERARHLAAGAWRALPLETVHVATAAACTILIIQDPHAAKGAPLTWLVRFILAALLATPLCFSLSLLAVKGRLGRPAQMVLGALLSLAVLAGVSLGLPDADRMSARFIWPYGLSLLAAVLAPFVVIAAASGASSRQDAFARFVRRFLEQTTIWALLLAAALAAVGVVFLALSSLFELRIERLAPQSCVVTLAIIVLPWIYRLIPEDGSQERVPEIWRRLVTVVGAPFVAVMLTILLAYEAVVALRGEYPRNLLSPLIIAAGAVGFLCTLVIVAILREPGARGPIAPAEPHPWVQMRSVRIARLFPLVLLVLLPMAGWALAVRIDEYGFTPARYVRLLALIGLAVLCVLGGVRFLRSRGALTWEVPLLTLGLALVGAFGPLSVVNVSLRSQTRRLEQLLAAAHVPTRVVAAESPEPMLELPDHEYHQLLEQIELVDDLGGEAALRRVLSGRVDLCRHAGFCLVGLGMKPSSRYHVAEAGPAFELPGAALEFVDLRPGPSWSSGELRLTLVERSLQVRRSGTIVATAPLDGLIEAAASGRLPTTPLVVTTSTGTRLGYLMVRRIAVEGDGAEARVDSLEGVWLTGHPE